MASGATSATWAPRSQAGALSLHSALLHPPRALSLDKEDHSGHLLELLGTGEGQDPYHTGLLLQTPERVWQVLLPWDECPLQSRGNGWAADP